MAQLDLQKEVTAPADMVHNAVVDSALGLSFLDPSSPNVCRTSLPRHVGPPSVTTGGFFLPEFLRPVSSNTQRVMFFVDGFNLYHSLDRVNRRQPDVPVKWLDLRALASAQLYILGPTATLAAVHYFTAFAEHLAKTNPDKLARHRSYVRALTATGVEEHHGHFKQKDVWIESLGRYERIWQEKATDVGIVAELFARAGKDEFETAVIVSGDADYAPAIPVFRALFPQKRVVFAFPFDRKNKELARLVPESFTLSAESYAKYQFPDAVRLPSGKFVVRPSVWRGVSRPSAEESTP